MGNKKEWTWKPIMENLDSGYQLFSSTRVVPDFSKQIHPNILYLDV